MRYIVIVFLHVRHIGILAEFYLIVHINSLITLSTLMTSTDSEIFVVSQESNYV
jgi:hypothetical protein